MLSHRCDIEQERKNICIKNGITQLPEKSDSETRQYNGALYKGNLLTKWDWNFSLGGRDHSVHCENCKQAKHTDTDENKFPIECRCDYPTDRDTDD
jgi:hypothetical protein